MLDPQLVFVADDQDADDDEAAPPDDDDAGCAAPASAKAVGASLIWSRYDCRRAAFIFLCSAFSSPCSFAGSFQNSLDLPESPGDGLCRLLEKDLKRASK